MRPPADPPAQLVQLREPEAVGILDDHDRGVGNVDADLDHGGRHEHIDLPASERAHRRIPLLDRHPAVQDAHPEIAERAVL